MAYLLFLFGILGVIAGGWATAATLQYAALSPYSLASSILGAAPGLIVIVVSVFMLAAGEALIRLAEIDRNTRRSYEEARRLADHVTRDADAE